MGGAKYIKSIRAPFPNIEIMPTGGLRKEDFTQFAKVGVVAIGVGARTLIPDQNLSGR